MGEVPIVGALEGAVLGGTQFASLRGSARLVLMIALMLDKAVKKETKRAPAEN